MGVNRNNNMSILTAQPSQNIGDPSMDHDPRQWVGLSNPSRSETGEGILRPSVDRSISAAIPNVPARARI